MYPNPITAPQAHDLVSQHGSPLYVYDSSVLLERARLLLGLSLPYGFTVRYALKANPHARLVALLHDAGMHFDASSSYEAEQLLAQGIPAGNISLSSQQPAHNLAELVAAGVGLIATSLHQLEMYAAAMGQGAELGLRVNAGVTSGYSNRVKTAGITASFGLWHEHLGDALTVAQKHGVRITTLHSHIGSGSDPAVWGQAMDAALAIVEQLPDVHTLDIGGGYKVDYSQNAGDTDMQQVAAVFTDRLRAFAERTGRQLHLEIEPGRWLVARSGVLLTQIVDMVDTGSEGYKFLRTNTGMNDFLRPTLYGAQHRMRVLNNAAQQTEYVVVGHNCESGDILTTEPANPEAIMPRLLNKAQIGDLLAIEDAGAYCAALRAHGYNAYPSAPEVVV